MGEVIDIRAKLERDRLRREGHTVYGSIPEGTMVVDIDFHTDFGVILATEQGIMHCPDGEEFKLLEPVTAKQVEMSSQPYDGWFFFN